MKKIVGIVLISFILIQMLFSVNIFAATFLQTSTSYEGGKVHVRTEVEGKAGETVTYVVGGKETLQEMSKGDIRWVDEYEFEEDGTHTFEFYAGVGVLGNKILIGGDAVPISSENSYVPKDFVLYYQDGELVSEPESGEIKAEIGIVNETETSQNLSLILASYDATGTQLLSTSCKSVEAAAGSCFSYDTATVSIKEGESVRVYLWKENMEPVANTGDLRICSPSDTDTEKINMAYNAIDREFNGVLDWLVELYDPESGGFYNTVSGATYEGYSPSLEATAFVYSMLGANETGAIEGMPEEFKQKLIKFFQERQNPDDGYFYDIGFEPEYYTDRDKIRVYGQCVAKLKALGAQPLYPLPTQRSEVVLYAASTAALPSYCQSPELFMEYVKGLNWDSDSWTAGDTTYEAMTYVLQLPPEEAEPYKTALLEWLEERQDSVTGYWGKSGDLSFNAVSGAFKVARIYERFNMCPPNPQKILESILATLQSGELPTAACYVRNPISAVLIIKNYEPQLVKEIYGDREAELVQSYRKYIQSMFRADGGASSNSYKSQKKFGGIPAGMELCEGDVDGTRQMLLAREYLRDVFGREVSNQNLKPQYTAFWERIMSKSAIVKKSYDLGGQTLTQNFEDYDSIEKMYGDFWSSQANGAALTRDGENQFVTLSDTSPAINEALRWVFPRIYREGTISCKLRVDRDDPYSQGGNDMSYTYFRIAGGEYSLVEVHAVDSGSNTVKLYVVHNAAGGNQYTYLTDVKRGEWFDLKVIFRLNQGKAETEYYVNKAHITAADNLYTQRLCNQVDGLGIATNVARKSRISIDEIVVTGE